MARRAQTLRDRPTMSAAYKNSSDRRLPLANDSPAGHEVNPPPAISHMRAHGWYPSPVILVLSESSEETTIDFVADQWDRDSGCCWEPQSLDQLTQREC